jgi:pyruvate kinase
MRTKIITTIGPANLDTNVFINLAKEGIDCIRINTAYGDYDQYDTIISNLRKAEKILRKDIKVVFDIKNNDVIEYFNKNNLDIIALSFTETAEQIKEVRELAPKAFVVSKIESTKGVHNFEEIIDMSDGVMIARGDLSKSETIEKVPPLQKQFTQEGIKKEKFVIAATEMLMSMVKKPYPTNAEASDVANAVFDGVSAVMLSEETAIGKYPVEAVSFMRRIIIEAEAWQTSYKT